MANSEANAEMSSSRTRTTPADVDQLLKKVEDQSRLLQNLVDDVSTIRTALPASGLLPHLPLHATSNEISYREIWQEQILNYRVNTDADGLLKDFAWKKGLTLEQVLSPRQPWNRWQYKLSYPRLSSFLQEAAQDTTSRSQVICEDSNDRGKVSRWESKKGILDQESLWHSISTRTESRRSTYSDASLGDSSDADLVLFALSRNMRVLDLSPMVAAMMLGATPRINLSSTAPFLERYLSFCNYAHATLFGMKSTAGTKTNAFVFEYHFAFYFVPKGTMELGLAARDFRNIRRSSAFGPQLNESSQWIYEEQLSILLMGQGADVFTIYQLAERYFRGPYIKGTGHASLFINPDRTRWTPCGMFLSWILMALHHVRFRWQSAIEAVDNQIVSPSDIIFSKQDPDLLSDDPQFSKSKTYFWALQAYKMFDERLEQTIGTWLEFRKDALYKLNDGRMSEETWDFTVASIDVGIDKLRAKLIHVREKSQEVRNLREGLFGASALFDSRTTVRQGDNIRLLTYITLLFLPLSFCTSIFGMQVVLPTLPIKVFIITVPTIFVFTALLVFNLQNLIDFWDVVTARATLHLRRSMRGRRTWSDTARALHYDKITNQAPIKPRDRHSTRWSYVLYGIEAVIIHLPVQEVNWFFSCLRAFPNLMSHFSHPGRLQKGNCFDAATKELSHLELATDHSPPTKSNVIRPVQSASSSIVSFAPITPKSRAARVRAVRVAQLSRLTPHRAVLTTLLTSLSGLVRLLLLPISLTLVLIYYILLLPVSPLDPLHPLTVLDLYITRPPPPKPGIDSNSDIGEDHDAVDQNNTSASRRRKPSRRKMTIVSIAGSADTVFQPSTFEGSGSGRVHPSRRRWRKAEETVESGLNPQLASSLSPTETQGIKFRGDVWGSANMRDGGDIGNATVKQGDNHGTAESTSTDGSPNSDDHSITHTQSTERDQEITSTRDFALEQEQQQQQQQQQYRNEQETEKYDDENIPPNHKR